MIGTQEVPMNGRTARLLRRARYPLRTETGEHKKRWEDLNHRERGKYRREVQQKLRDLGIRIPSIGTDRPR